MLLANLELRDFRNYAELNLDLSEGVTVFVGSNGNGKTNLLEAVGYLSSLSSFRGAPDAAMVRSGSEAAIVRAEGERDERRLLIEAEIRAVGRNRTQVNRQPLRRSRDLLGAIRTTVFAPDDLDLIKGSPASRRRYVDELAVAVDPTLDARRSEVERILRQRNTLLKQVKGRLDENAAATLDVWDVQLADAGEALGRMRREVVDRVGPIVAEAYVSLAGRGREVAMAYEPEWAESGLAAALAAARSDDLRRGVTTVGPHRDEVVFSLGGTPARTHASQGECRSIALAMRLGAHFAVTEATGSPPVLLLDDVFSELDGHRRAALLAHLPRSQTLLTTAADIPEGTDPDLVFHVEHGNVRR